MELEEIRKAIVHAYKSRSLTQINEFITDVFLEIRNGDDEKFLISAKHEGYQMNDNDVLEFMSDHKEERRLFSYFARSVRSYRGKLYMIDSHTKFSRVMDYNIVRLYCLHKKIPIEDYVKDRGFDIVTVPRGMQCVIFKHPNGYERCIVTNDFCDALVFVE